MCITNVDLSRTHWDEAPIDEERPRTRLLATLQLNGILHHLEAIEVEYDDRTLTQSATCALCDDILSQYREATGADGRLSTVVIEGRTYALFVTPYCS
jgi:hypothetical protein